MDILVPDISVAEKLVRSVVVCGFLLVAFRVCGKRQLGQLTAFDLVVVLIIRSKRADRIVEHSPTLLVRHGRIRPEIAPAQGLPPVRDFRYAFLEEDGRVSVIRRPPDE